MDLRLLAILDPASLPDQDPVAAARAAVEGGATALQVRMKKASAAKLWELTRRLLGEIAVPVFVNDRADVAWAAGAHGVHLGQEDVPADAVRRWSPPSPSFRIGVSVGSTAESDRARSWDAAVDYWSIGPLYRTASKADAGEPLGPRGFSALARHARPGLPVIGIGGITRENAAAVIHAGAAGVAVISALFALPTPQIADAARAIREAVDGALETRRAPP
jgi:thiamine-phosphate pyrophosphorylase